MRDDVDFVRHVHELARELERVEDLKQLYRRAVQGLLDPLGFDRAALFLYDSDKQEMSGTWGTDEAGHVVDESDYRSFLNEKHAFLAEALADPERLKIWYGRELRLWDKVVGIGWNAMVVLQDGERVLGWLALDNAIHQKPLTAMEREVLSLYGRALSSIIQRRQFEVLSDKYRSQNALKDRLFTILAHDLRGPIGNIGMLLGLAMDTKAGSLEMDEVLHETREAAVRTYNLLENVLGWVRSQMEEVTALRVRIPLERPLNSVKAWLSATAKAKNIAIEVECHPSLTLVTDERMIETVLRNLVSNAVKYSAEGTTVLLRGRIEDGKVLYEVVDCGVGLPQEKVDMLFSKDQKSSQPGTAGEGGNGLGLMFSSDLVRSLEGQLEAESQLGVGSTFRIVLPDELDGEL